MHPSLAALLKLRQQAQTVVSMQSSSAPMSAQTISDRYKLVPKENLEKLGLNLFVRYLTTDMTWDTYRTLATFLDCIEDYSFRTYRAEQLKEIDRQLLEHLVNHTSLSAQTIYHKLIFLKDFSHGYKTAAALLLKSSNTA